MGDKMNNFGIFGNYKKVLNENSTEKYKIKILLDNFYSTSGTIQKKTANCLEDM